MKNQTSITADNLDMVQLDQIKENPNNPRKYYDEVQLNELAESIKSYGVLQPITVRRLNGYRNFEVVAGNRRYKASLLAGIKAIPAVVRELSDEQALEIALIENIQRVDVHPMEEAVSFKQLIEKQNYTPEDVAHKFGKSVFFVRQRLKLNNLSEDSRKLFFEDKFNIANAVKLAQYNDDIQNKILENAKHYYGIYEFRNGSFYVYEVKLSTATFDITDSSLIASAGACTDCPFNTSVGSLFPEDEENPRCLKSECFKEKTKVAYENQLNEAIEQGYELANNSYKETELTKELLNKGVAIIPTNSSFYVINKPEKPDYEEFKKEWLEDNEEDEDTMQEEWVDKMNEYEDELAEYNNKVNSGNTKQVFIIDGNGKGTYQTIEITSKDTDEDDKDNPVSNEYKQILQQIKNIEFKERRAKQLDGEKVWTKIRELTSNDALVSEGLLNEIEIECLIEALKSKLSWKARKTAETYLETAEGKIGNNVIAYISRLFILDILPSAYGSHLTEDSNNHYAYNYIKGILPQEVAAIELEQEGVANSRIEKVNANITSLRKQLSNVAT